MRMIDADQLLAAIEENEKEVLNVFNGSKDLAFRELARSVFTRCRILIGKELEKNTMDVPDMNVGKIQGKADRRCWNCIWWNGNRDEKRAFCDEHEIETSDNGRCKKWQKNPLRTQEGRYKCHA